jgi:amidase
MFGRRGAKGSKSMKIVIICGVIAAASSCMGADLSGDWIAELKTKGADPQYARVHLTAEKTAITGTWNQSAVEGSISDGRLQLLLRGDGGPSGTLTGTATGETYSGEGQLQVEAGGGSANTENVSWTLTRPAQRPSGAPTVIDFEPSEFHGYYSASYAPVLHVFPGDTIRTRTFDASGRDADRKGPGGNPETGPFYVEGALPKDTLVIKLNKVRPNRDSARQGTRINGRAVTPAFVEAAKYDPEYNTEWTLDREKGIAVLTHPSERMKNFKVPILPMIGCISTAPPGNASYRSTELGPYGGNMDYNQMAEGATLYLPVFHPGALLTLGDGHAAMGDGELTGTALETSLDVELTVDLIKGHATPFPRLENADYVMSMGIGGSVADALQSATAQLADWIKREYGLTDSEVAILLGAVLKYDITELVDPQFNVVAKVPKTALATLK